MTDNDSGTVSAIPTPDTLDEARAFCEFVKDSPTAFHAASEVCRRLDAEGFLRVDEVCKWRMDAGAYYTCRNGSSVIAWRIPEGAYDDIKGDMHYARFQIAAAHGDSPTFKLKSNPCVNGAGVRTKCFDVEAYGGPIDHTWFDRPLGVAGRVLVRTRGRVESRLVRTDKPVGGIPSLALHLDRSVNESFSPNRARDMRPVFSLNATDSESLMNYVAAGAGAFAGDVVAFDLYLTNFDEPRIWGVGDEFLSAPRIDDLMCAYAALKGFLGARLDRAGIAVYALFDNEEVGSNTKQGAMSTFLSDTLRRIVGSLGGDYEDYCRILSRSMLVSCDNAHAVHPNRPDMYDEANSCVLNGGIVIKEAANQHYCTDAFSRAVFTEVCERAGVPYQTFANRSDMAGGSTLGNLSNIQASMHGVDVGCAQWAMHSALETAGSCDVSLARRTLEAYYSADIRINGAESFRIL